MQFLKADEKSSSRKLLFYKVDNPIHLVIRNSDSFVIKMLSEFQLNKICESDFLRTKVIPQGSEIQKRRSGTMLVKKIVSNPVKIFKTLKTRNMVKISS